MFTRCVRKMCVQDSQNFVSQDMLTRHPVAQDTNHQNYKICEQDTPETRHLFNIDKTCWQDTC